MFLDDSACNLASLNLMKFRTVDGGFDVERFCRAIRVFIIAQEILVDNASYPTDVICRNSHRFRALGLGYANLGSLVMSQGLAYDSQEGRALAGAITAILTGKAYAVSAELSGIQGPFESSEDNRKDMLKVIGMHQAAVDRISTEYGSENLLSVAREVWTQALALGKKNGYRNAQVTVLAPTGTIGFMMDCDTTGVEPDIALVKYKMLAGGGSFKIINRTVPLALKALGYNPAQIRQIDDYILAEETIEGAPHLRDEHLAVFDCAFKPAKGERCIAYAAHLKMMSVAQQFLSGAISKTINMPNEVTVEEIMETYIAGWKLGLKAVAIYRDGSKRAQPILTKNDSKSDSKSAVTKKAQTAKAGQGEGGFEGRPRRKRLPATRRSITHKFDVAGHEGYLTVGLYENGEPGELFITMAKEGSTVGGMMDAFGTAISLTLQYGVPLRTMVDKFSHQRFEPSGITSNREIPFAKSIVDYIFRWLAMEFVPGYRKANAPQRGGKSSGSSEPEKTAVMATGPALSDAKPKTPPKSSATGGNGGNGGRGKNAPKREKVQVVEVSAGPAGKRVSAGTASVELPAALTERYNYLNLLEKEHRRFHSDAPACDNCGAITVPNGTCYRCYNCGSSMGCS